MSGKKVYAICAVIALICLFLSYKKQYVYPEHISGAYELSAILSTQSGAVVIPFMVFGDSNWGYYDCQTEKENRTNRPDNATIFWRLKWTCGKYYGEEI